MTTLSTLHNLIIVYFFIKYDRDVKERLRFQITETLQTRMKK
jgi:hypothetical protein